MVDLAACWGAFLAAEAADFHELTVVALTLVREALNADRGGRRQAAMPVSGFATGGEEANVLRLR